jgi:hypothetical protein
MGNSLGLVLSARDERQMPGRWQKSVTARNHDSTLGPPPTLTGGIAQCLSSNALANAGIASSMERLSHAMATSPHGAGLRHQIDGITFDPGERS